MKKQIGLFLGLVLIASLGYFAFKKESSPEGPVLNTPIEAKQSVSPNIESKRETFAAESHAPIQLKAEPNKIDPPGCQQSWGYLAGMAPTSFGGVATQNLGTTFAFGRESDLKKFKDALNYGGRCNLDKGHPLKGISDEVTKECYSQDPQASKTISLLNCMQAILKLRFEVIDYLTKDQPVDQIQDESLIGAKIYAQVMKPNEKRNPGLLMELSRRALELDPENVSAAEYLVQGAYLKHLENPNAPISQEFEGAIQKLSESFPNSPLAFEAQMALARQKKDFGFGRRLAEDAKEMGQNGDMVSYQLAWSSYVEGREDEAKNYLNEILQRNPDFYLAKTSLEQLNNGSPVPAEIKELVAPFFGQLGQFNYAVTMAPVLVENPQNAPEE